VINLLKKYCTEENLKEFLDIGNIKKFETNLEDDEEMQELFLHNALMKIEMYGIRYNPPLLTSNTIYFIFPSLVRSPCVKSLTRETYM